MTVTVVVVVPHTHTHTRYVTYRNFPAAVVGVFDIKSGTKPSSSSIPRDVALTCEKVDAASHPSSRTRPGANHCLVIVVRDVM